MRFLCAVLLSFSLLLTGCPGLIAAIPTIVEIVSDATAVLSIIERALDSWYAVAPPDAETRQKANQLLTNAWTALRIANSATKGAEHLSKDETKKAFEEFRTAYSDLHKFLTEQGVLKASRLSLGGNDGDVEIPTPLALQL